MSAPAQTPLATSLRSLAESKTDGITKSTTFRVDPDKIKFERGFNLREQNDELDLHIDRLAAAMEAGAFIPPVDVQISDKGEIIARDGHCRTKAAQKVKKKNPDYTLECRQLRGNEVDAVLHMLGTGSGQKALTPLEQGRGYLRLIKMGLEAPTIAAKLGVSRVTVDNGLTLAEAPVEVQQLISSGAVSSTTAREAIKQGPEGVAALKKAAADAETAPQATGKGGKKSTKKKVTAKKLRGTAADKTTKKKGKGKSGKKAAKGAAPAAAETPALAEDEIMVKVKKPSAQLAVDFLKANAPDTDPALNEFIATLEMVLL